MDLYACAVHLVVEHGPRQGVDGAADVLRGLCQHRLDRGADGEPDAAQSGRAGGHRQGRGAGQVALQHPGVAHVGAGASGGAGDRLDHHAVERALPEFADQEADQEALLFRDAPAEEGAQGVASRRGGTRSRGGTDALHDGVHLRHGQRGGLGGGDGRGFPKRGGPDPDASLR